MINRPVNTTGLTGLISATSPFVLPARTFEIGLMALSENSLVPNYTSTAYHLTASTGIGHAMEIALNGTFRSISEDPGVKARGVGDTELSWKWNFRPQREYSSIPGIAVFATGVFPTADRETGMSSVAHWGGRIGVSLGSEIAWEDHIIGIYADGQVAFQDVSDKEFRDSYTVTNMGLLFPISKYRNLQMVLEYTRRTGKDVMNIDGLDFSAVTYGLRLVSERFNLTFGTQFIHKPAVGYDDSSRIVGMMSVKL